MITIDQLLECIRKLWKDEKRWGNYDPEERFYTLMEKLKRTREIEQVDLAIQDALHLAKLQKDNSCEDVWYDLQNLILSLEQDQQKLKQIQYTLNRPPKHPDGDEMDRLENCETVIESIKGILSRK